MVDIPSLGLQNEIFISLQSRGLLSLRVIKWVVLAGYNSANISQRYIFSTDIKVYLSLFMLIS